MPQPDMDSKVKEYTENYRFWAGQAITQFGFSINIFLSIGIGFIGFLATQRASYPKFYFCFWGQINWTLLLYLLVLLTSLLSVVFGLTSVTSRLYDLRIMRRLSLIRRRLAAKKNMQLPDYFLDLSKESRVKNFAKIWYKEVAFIYDDDLNNLENLKLKFQQLTKQARLLGRTSWMAHKYQIGFLLASVILYIFSFLK